MQRDIAVRGRDPRVAPLEVFDVRRDVEEALRPEEESGTRPARATHESQVFVELGVGRPRRHVDASAPALGVEAGGNCDRLHQCRLATAVLAGEEGYLRMERELVQLLDRGDREWVDIEVRDLVALQHDRADERIARLQRPFPFSAMRALTSFVTSAAGIGLSGPNWIEPLPCL